MPSNPMPTAAMDTKQRDNVIAFISYLPGTWKKQNESLPSHRLMLTGVCCAISHPDSGPRALVSTPGCWAVTQTNFDTSR